MNAKQILAKSEAVIAPALRAEGFRMVEPGIYERDSREGIDRIAVSPANGRFAVMVSFLPEYTLIAKTLAGREDVGFPVGPFLTPTCVSGREKFWRARTPEDLGASVLQVLEAIRSVAMPWLMRLRAPGEYLAQVNPNGPIFVGLAAEAARDSSRAKAAYERAYERYAAAVRLPVRRIPEEVARPFIFVALKLGRDKELLGKLQKDFNFWPTVKPIDNH